jgi:exopolysaccharide biosynthesis polyprenyl glycosylphosphotransferase
MARLNEQSIWFRLFMQIADILMTAVSFVTAFKLRSQIRSTFFFGTALSVEAYYNVLILLVILWWFLLDIQKAYSEGSRVTLSHQIKTVIRAAVVGTFALLIIGYVMRMELPPRSAVFLFVFLNIVFLSLNRAFFRSLHEYLREEGALSKTILVVGAGEKAMRFLNAVHNHDEWGANLVGFVEFDSHRVGETVMNAKILGTSEDLVRILHEYPITEVVFAISTRQMEQCTDMLALCEQEGVNAVILSDFFSSLVAQVETEILYDQPVLIYKTTRHKEWQLLVKRIFDIGFSGLLLLLLLPLLAVIALVIKLTDRGPIFYTWKVVGKDKRKFSGYKFRTMVMDADKIKEKLLQQNEMSGIVFKMKDDPRITRIGRFLRKYSLDELPQLWSVLLGHMSVVGPRPPLETELKLFESWHRRKLSVKPGLTCLWQISGRSSIRDFDEWVKLDLAYIDKWSLWLDFKILLKTIPVVLTGRGAH